VNTAGNGPNRAVGAMGYGYWMNYVGNVLGESGVTTGANNYIDDQAAAVGRCCENEIWLLDTNVAATAIRDGNWDWFLSKQTWLTTPSAAGETIPSSLYLTSEPAFFQGDTWPWVGPTTGTT
jgi:hypothetical protein